MKKRQILVYSHFKASFLFLLMFCIAFSSFVSATTIFYDDFSDGIVNNTIWYNYSDISFSGGGTISATTLETSGYFELHTQGTSGGAGNRALAILKTQSNYKDGNNYIIELNFSSPTNSGFDERGAFIEINNGTQYFAINSSIYTIDSLISLYNTTTTQTETYYKIIIKASGTAEVYLQNGTLISTKNISSLSAWYLEFRSIGYTAGSNFNVNERIHYVNSSIGNYIKLNSPSNNSIFLKDEDISFNFTALSTSNSSQLTNVSLFVDGTRVKTDTITGIENTSVLTYAINTTGNKSVYLESCDDTGVCSTTDIYNFVITKTIISDSQYRATAYETSIQDFYINVTGYKTILSATAVLNYNGTRYTATEDCSGTLCEISTAINLPLINASANKTFFWELSIYFTDDSSIENTTIETQTISPIILAVCNGTYTTQALNFSVFDEETLATINPFRFESTINYWLGTGLTYKTFTYTNSSVNNFVNLCISPGTENFTIDGQLEYDESTGSNYSTRNYFFENYTINNQSQNIGLGLLKATDSTSFIIVVQDAQISPVPDALVYTQRYYPGTNEYITTQVSQTDDNGKTVGFFKTETVDYRFIVEYNGSVVLTTNKQKIIPETTPYTITLTIGETTGIAWEGFEDIPGLDSSVTWNKTTQIVTLTYIDSTGNLTNAELVVERIRVNELTNLEICSSSSTSSSASLTCNLTGNQTGTYYARFIATINGETKIINQVTIIISDFASELSTYGLFIAILIIMISATTFYFNNVIGIILINITLIGLNVIGLINLGGGFLTAIVSLSIIILVVLNK